MINEHASQANPFIGRERELDWLKIAWTQARCGHPQVCVLRGESGFGKTRIVQAFYSWLSSAPEYDAQGYWPDLLLKEGNNLRLNPPPASFGTGKVLPWLWWGVRWNDPDVHNRGELSSCALIDGLHHLEPHREALLERNQESKRRVKAAAELGAVAGELLSFGIVGATKSLVELWQLLREERHSQEQTRLGVEERQAAALQAQIDGLVGFLRGILAPSAAHTSGLPLILTLDDAHWIDARSLAAVGRLLAGAQREGWPLLLIVTHWERDWNLQAQDATLASFPGLCSRLAVAPAGENVPESGLAIEVRDIGRLDGIEQLLGGALPGLSVEQQAFLCARADGNPRLMNEIILELRDEASYFENDDLGQPLRAEALAELRVKSFSLHDVQKRRFRRLDPALRKLLADASYHGMHFLRALVLDVAQVVDAGHSREDDAALLAQAVHPYAVLAAESAVLDEFRHRVFHDLAREPLDRSPQRVSRLSEALLRIAGDWLEQGQLASLAPPEREMFYRLMLEQRAQLTDAAFPQLRLRLIAGLFGLYRQSGHFSRALEWSDALANELPADGCIALEVLSVDDQLAMVYGWLELDRREASERLARGLVETCRSALSESAANPDRLLDLAAAEVGLGDLLRRADKPQEARELYENALATFERLVSELGETAERLRAVSVSQIRVGDLLLAADKPQEARELYEKSLAICERIVSKFGETAERLRDVSGSQDRVGDVLRRTDRPQEARTLYEKMLATCERIVSEFGETAERLRDLSVSQQRVGDLLLTADQPQEARALYEKSLAIGERIFSELGETAERLRDLSVSQHKVGDVLLRADKPQEALALYEKSLATCERIVSEFGETAQRLRDLSVSQVRVGDVLRADRPQEARALYEKSLATCERIVSEFGETAQRLRDVLLSQHRIGDLLLRADQPENARALYEKSLATCERIVSEFGETAERLRDLSVSKNKFGDVLLRADQPEKARALYEKSLASCERIVSEFGETAERLRDLAISQNRVGDVLRRADQPEKARELYEKSLATGKRILRDFGETAERLRGIALSLLRLGVCAAQIGDRVLTHEHLAASESLFVQLAARIGTISAQNDLEWVRARIADLGQEADDPDVASQASTPRSPNRD